MSKAVNDIARTLLDELDAEAKILGDRLQVVNASRAQIHRLLGGKPAKGSAPSSPTEPPPDGAGEKPPRGRKAKLGDWRGEAPGQGGILAAVVGGAPAEAIDARGNADALAVLGQISGLETLPCVVVRRKAFPNAFSAGLSVTEHAPRDQKAVDEILSVVNALYAQGEVNGY